jgi:hypothetical protein
MKPAPRASGDSERNRIPPGVQKIRQEQQKVVNLTDFSFP